MDVDELDLPTDFEVIVVGTGLVESIVAAACSRIGKNVLHLDSRDHYGGLWASHNFDFLQKFIKEVTTDPSRQPQLYNLNEKWYIPKESSQEGEDDKTDEGKDQAKKVWSQADFAAEYRKFNIDMTPKLLFSRGPLVELLISSNIARYAEFRCVTRVLTWLNDKLVPVPCSRADVFATEAVSIVEKRMLMKMLTSIVGYNDEEMENEFKDWNDKTFQEYLTHKGLTPNLIHYVLYAIAGGTNSMPCLEGVRECKKFLMSLGRYGNTPFLWPMYGSGELPQCFCRLCAVFGGVYCLNRPIDSVEYKTVDDKKVVVIGSKSKTLNCDHVVLGTNEVPKDLLSQEPVDSSDISRAIFITNGTIMPSEKEPLTLLRFPPLTEDNNAVTVLEVGPATGSCPKGLFVVYFIANKVTDAESDLMPYAEKIFDMSGADQADASDKPKCLWSLFYNVKDTRATVKEGLDNVFVCSGPDAGLDFDRAVHQAEEIFRQICPGQEFLPRAPDPEEIVFEDDVPTGPEFTRDDPDAPDAPDADGDKE